MRLIALLLAMQISAGASGGASWSDFPWDTYWQHTQQTNLAMLKEKIADWQPPAPKPHTTVARPLAAIPMAPDAVRALIAGYFAPEDVDRALAVSWCESHWDPSAYNSSSAAGLFQVMSGWYQGRWSSYPPFDPFDPVENTKFAAWLAYNSGWQNWNPSRSCWGG